MIKGQRGFTLPEMLITVAITGLIAASVGGAIYQIITVTNWGNARMTALHELQNAGHWLSLDGQMASMASASSGLALTLPDDSSITYEVEDTQLLRTTDESQMVLARNISGVSFSVENRLITMTLTSSPQGWANISEHGTYKVCLRPAEGES